MPDRLPEVEYDDTKIVRTVGTTKTYIGFKGRLWKVPQAFRGERVAIRPHCRWSIRHLFRQPPDRNYRLDHSTKCQPCPRTGVRHVPD
jgi:hypothetical protein